MKVLIVHGWKAGRGHPGYTRIAELLNERGIYGISLPQLPHPNLPIMRQWERVIEREVRNADNSRGIYIIAHSLGAFAAMRALEQTGNTKQIGGALLISPTFQFLYRNIPNLLYRKPDLRKVRLAVKKIVLMHAPDDRTVAFANSRDYLGHQLDARLIALDGAGHFNPREDFDSARIIADTFLCHFGQEA